MALSREQIQNWTSGRNESSIEEEPISKVDEKTQAMYRSGVGTLLYLTKHSRPDITNPVRELSKSMDGASMAHVTEMYRVINFVLERRT